MFSLHEQLRFCCKHTQANIVGFLSHACSVCVRENKRKGVVLLFHAELLASSLGTV